MESRAAQNIAKIGVADRMDEFRRGVSRNALTVGGKVGKSYLNSATPNIAKINH
jgi:hypothetical protein